MRMTGKSNLVVRFWKDFCLPVTRVVSQQYSEDAVQPIESTLQVSSLDGEEALIPVDIVNTGYRD